MWYVMYAIHDMYGTHDKSMWDFCKPWLDKYANQYHSTWKSVKHDYVNTQTNITVHGCLQTMIR